MLIPDPSNLQKLLRRWELSTLEMRRKYSVQRIGDRRKRNVKTKADRLVTRCPGWPHTAQAGQIITLRCIPTIDS